jgi:peptidoglycan hydrolase-like protein with peptidoglycan-binding domain
VGYGASNQIILRWQNPTDGNFVRTKIVRKDNTDPFTISDGTVVYEGTGTEFTDTKNLSSGVEYHYALYALDRTLTPSAPARFTTRLGSKTDSEIMKLLSVSSPSTPTSTPCTTTTASVAATLTLPRALYFGIAGSDVTTLQQALNSLGYTVAVTGTYDANTQIAVQKFQCKEMKICSGTYITTGYGRTGNGTIATLKIAYGNANKTTTTTKCAAVTASPTTSSATSINRTLAFGTVGADVTLLQQKLKEKGYFDTTFVPVDTFGPKTLTVVQKFQCDSIKVCSGTPATTGYGLVGRMTRAALGL